MVRDVVNSWWVLNFLKTFEPVIDSPTILQCEIGEGAY